jgi:hypothetical protein
MTVPTNAEPNNTTKMEPKVKWAGIGAYLAGVVVLALVNAFTGDDNALLIEALPDVVEPFILPAIPAVVAAISGYFAKHQWRSAEVTGNL